MRLSSVHGWRPDKYDSYSHSFLFWSYGYQKLHQLNWSALDHCELCLIHKQCKKKIILSTLCFIVAIIKCISCYFKIIPSILYLVGDREGGKKSSTTLTLSLHTFAHNLIILDCKDHVYMCLRFSITSLHVCLFKNGPQKKPTSAKRKGRLCMLWPVWFQSHTAPNTRKESQRVWYVFKKLRKNFSCFFFDNWKATTCILILIITTNNNW